MLIHLLIMLAKVLEYILNFFLNIRAQMLPGTVDLGPAGVLYIDEIQNAIAIGEVEHKLTVDLSVR